ncbi:ATP-binding protein [Amycolatopsis decaplanina]|uniref:Anti-sigma regulatory factor, serine/threonine protein kinase n=1 Tax=Amycolatopsis decaplanina DSM 44594 TaxID=1284240 RepID=M2XIN9_9PSEU|nr:ATP-binding protein [Amycolatopsis decaplanina]EME60911.1 anti-sigma regulatory factor, serine/threonine protein kinase [Amycolatopsis decaplanina DSM 44594]
MVRSDSDVDVASPEVGTVLGAPIDTAVRPAFEEFVPALPGEVALLRRRLSGWLDELPIDTNSKYDITIATYEALANTAVHAYPGRRGWVRLHADWAGDAITVTVADTGDGIPAARSRVNKPASGGRGLRLIDELTDQMTIDTGAHGTRVSLVWRPAALRRNTAS